MPTILVVDDVHGLRDLIANILQDDGYDVVTAANGRIAEEYLRSGEAVDLVLTDIFMPEQDGITVLMAALRDGRDIRLVAMSGGAQVIGGDFLDTARRLGVSRTLRKPFTVQELREAVTGALDGPGLGAPASAG